MAFSIFDVHMPNDHLLADPKFYFVEKKKKDDDFVQYLMALLKYRTFNCIAINATNVSKFNT